MKRRDFIQTSSAAALGTLVFPEFLSAFKKIGQIGVQLYSVRDAMSKDVIGTLTKVAQIGYNHVELAGYVGGKVYGKSPAEFKKILDDLGLKTFSSHLGLDILRGDWERAVADAKLLGQKYVVCPYLMENERKNIDQYKKLCELLNKCGETAQKAGLQLAYHNHDFEFITLDGQIPFDLMLKECDANLVKIEMDLYWTKKAGKDPLAYFKNNPGRIELWHVKDMDNTPQQFFTEVGNGTIDWKPIFKASKKSGMKYFFVEQDICKNHLPLESIEISYKYLKNLRY
ncbi:MAG: sugar phosphate isomerase/epimerase [Saprospiraceae bacterium]|nr:sugar phosphate isomerase/epimerase [Saprospiraceae bacterium]